MTTFDDEQFALVEAAAIAGDRCPKSHPFGPLKGGPLQRMVADRKIRIEIFAGNWRVITILVGPNKGKSTQASPKGGQPYRTFNGNDVVRLRGAA